MKKLLLIWRGKDLKANKVRIDNTSSSFKSPNSSAKDINSVSGKQNNKLIVLNPVKTDKDILKEEISHKIFKMEKELLFRSKIELNYIGIYINRIFYRTSKADATIGI